jgi:hypothetical protein
VIGHDRAVAVAALIDALDELESIRPLLALCSGAT